MNTIYFDHVSATPLHPEVRRVIADYLQGENYGNPLSQHHIGDTAVEILDSARATVAQLINADPQEVVFTSGKKGETHHNHQHRAPIRCQDFAGPDEDGIPGHGNTGG